MKKLLNFAPLSIPLTLLIFISCSKKNNEFGVADTFTLDSLIISPTSVTSEFSVGWAVTTTGFPTFFANIYLSKDNTLDSGDLIISSSGSVDTYSEQNKLDDAQFYKIAPVTGGNQVLFMHNTTPQDPNPTWVQSAPVANPSGTSKYIIAYFFNTTGLQIKYGRRLIAVPVTFN